MNWTPTLAQRFILTLGAFALLFHGWERWEDDQSITLPVLGAVLLLTGALSNSTLLDRWASAVWEWVVSKRRTLILVAVLLTLSFAGLAFFSNRMAEQRAEKERAEYDIRRATEEANTRKSEAANVMRKKASFDACLKESEVSAIAASRRDAAMGNDKQASLKFWTEYGREHCEYMNSR